MPDQKIRKDRKSKKKKEVVLEPKVFREFEKIESKIKSEILKFKIPFVSILNKIFTESYKFTLNQRLLVEIYEEATKGCKIPLSDCFLFRALSTQYFLYNTSPIQADLALLDSLKILTFLILYCSEAKEDKVGFLMTCVDQYSKIVEADPKDLSSDQIDSSGVATAVYSCDHRDLLEVLASFLESSIIPFIEMCPDEGDDKKYTRFIKRATDNNQVYYEYAKYLCKKYIFEEKKRNRKYQQHQNYEHENNTEISREEFMQRIEVNSSIILDSRAIRGMFSEYLDKYWKKSMSKSSKESSLSKRNNKALKDQRVKLNKENYLRNSDDSSNILPSVVNQQNKAQLKDGFSPINSSNNPFDISDDAYLDKPHTSSQLVSSSKIDDQDRSGLNLFTDFERERTGFRADDSLNFPRKTNLSTDHNISSSYVAEEVDDKSEVDFNRMLEEKYGKELLYFFHLYFTECMNGKVYNCSEQDCKIPYVLSEMNDDDFLNEDISEPDMVPRLSHSFRISHNSQKEISNAEEYLKNVIKKNLKMQDFSDFYNNDTNKEGILNSYLRLLDVYSQLRIEVDGLGNQIPVKIFQTDILREFMSERRNGGVSLSLNIELMDIFDHKNLIIPIYLDNSPYVFVVKLDFDSPVVDLYHLEEKVDAEDEETQTDLTNIIFDILERAYEANNTFFDHKYFKGDRKAVQSLPQMISSLEQVVLRQEETEEIEKIDEEQMKHKIIDRLLSVVLI
ncbi:unnamed protein product [Moneuplotes crassus]|uniref:Uncharacterized protein n=1 Tax=Euplotes crassus TaxID=5936 RepID=A0AAD1Y3E5_EUPCR|nr:unnamed protein product [Moneuplotes crassus]